MKDSNVDPLEEFHKTMDEQIKNVQEGMAIQTDIQIMKDLKRLGGLGCFEVKMSPVDIKVSPGAASMQVGLFWEGEMALIKTKEDNEELRGICKKLVDKLENYQFTVDGELLEIVQTMDNLIK